MAELKSLIALSRTYTSAYRAEHSVEKLDYFFLAMMEIVANLTELGIERNRAITDEEEQNWFKGGYHLDFWDSDLNTDIYIPMVRLVEKLNFFRSKH